VVVATNEKKIDKVTSSGEDLRNAENDGNSEYAAEAGAAAGGADVKQNDFRSDVKSCKMICVRESVSFVADLYWS